MRFSPGISSAFLLLLLNVRIHPSVLKHVREIRRAICAQQTLRFTLIILPQTEPKQVKSRNVTATERPSIRAMALWQTMQHPCFSIAAIYLFIYLCMHVCIY